MRGEMGMKLKLLVGLLLTAGLTGCTSTVDRNTLSGARLGNYLDFRTLGRKDYTVLKGVEGKAAVTYTRFLFFPFYSIGIFNINMKNGGVGRESEIREEYSVFDFPSINPLHPENMAKNEAVYNALAKIPDADLLLQPRYSWKCVDTQYIVFSTETCTVTVRGKAIQINEG